MALFSPFISLCVSLCLCLDVEYAEEEPWFMIWLTFMVLDEETDVWTLRCRKALLYALQPSLRGFLRCDNTRLTFSSGLFFFFFFTFSHFGPTFFSSRLALARFLLSFLLSLLLSFSVLASLVVSLLQILGSPRQRKSNVKSCHHLPKATELKTEYRHDDQLVMRLISASELETRGGKMTEAKEIKFFLLLWHLYSVERQKQKHQTKHLLKFIYQFHIIPYCVQWPTRLIRMNERTCTLYCLPLLTRKLFNPTRSKRKKKKNNEAVDLLIFLRSQTRAATQDAVIYAWRWDELW